MEKLGNYLRKNLPELQAKVEDRLEVRLGKIDVKPIPKSNKEFDTLAMADNSAIYYNTNPVPVLFLTKNMMHGIAMHELAHIAHARLAGKHMDEIGVPEYIVEGFTACINSRLDRKTGPVYDAYIKKFTEEMSSRGIYGFDSIKEFVLKNGN